MPSCSREHPRIEYQGAECPLCAERRVRAETDGWSLLRDRLVESLATSGGEPLHEPGSDIRLGVVIPVRNREAALPGCMHALARQTRRPGPVIVVDADSEAPIRRALLSIEWPAQIVPLAMETWCKGAAINAGLRELPGDTTHALLLDVDILLHPEAVARICGWLSTHGAVAVAPRDVQGKEGFGFGALAALSRPRGPDQVGGVVAYPLPWLLRTGGMDESYVGRGFHDLDLWERARRDLVDPLYVDQGEVLALHRVHPVDADPEEVARNRRQFEARWPHRRQPVRPNPFRGGVTIEPQALGVDGIDRLVEIYQSESSRPHLPPTSPPVAEPPLPEAPLTCSEAGPGQSAFIDGLLSLGFVGVDRRTAHRASAAGRPVLYHGGHGLPPRGRAVVLWHSGLAGSDLMGEGRSFARVQEQALAGNLDLLWLESRDVLPPGAAGYMMPVWDPPGLARLGAPLPPKQGRAIMVGFCGPYPSAAKNIAAAVAGCCGFGAHIHISESSLEGERGPMVRALLRDEQYTAHPILSRVETVRLVASCDLLVHPSASDTWPYLALEAVYAGTPVIGSEAVAWMRGLDEAIRERCMVWPTLSSASVADCVRSLLDEPDDRAALLVAQRAELDRLAPLHRDRAIDDLRRVGFRLPGDAQREPLATPKAKGMPDLSDDVTVFVISSGEPSLADCHAHLDRQDCRFRREDIAGLTPMNRAFQAMLDRCQTPYYVQVDADMLLEPWAVSTLWAAMQDREQELFAVPDTGLAGVAQIVGWLWDEDVQRPIQGVKLYRHDVCSRYPYTDELSCEMGVNEQLRRDDYQVLGLPLGDQDLGGGKWARTRRTLGTHYASQTPAMAFERWQRLMQKHRRLPWMAWLGEYPPKLEAEWLADPGNETRRAKYLGAVAGLVGPTPTGERDASLPNQDYRRVAAYVGEYSHGPRELTLYLTDACNFRCHFGETPCKREAEGGVPHEGALTPDTLRAVLAQHPGIRSCCIAGFGEPLLHPDLPGLVAVLAERGVAAGIITNGSLLGQRVGMLRGFGATLAYVSVSLNAATAEEHATMSRTRLWPRVLDGIRAARAAGLRCGVSHVVTTGNVDRLPAFLALARDLDASFVHLHNPLPHAGPGDLGFRRDILHRGATRALAALDAARSAPGADRVEVWPEIIDLDAGPPGGGACLSPLVSIGVDAKGQVSGCRRVDPPDATTGGFMWPWRSHHYTGLLAAVTGDRPEAHPACRVCFGAWKG